MTNDQASLTTERAATIYYIAWRIRKDHPWRSEEFTSRQPAFSRYFALLERGWETYLEKRH